MNLKKILTVVLSINFISFFIYSETPAQKQQRINIVECAKFYLGTPYVYGGNTKKGVDCSSLVGLSASDAGITGLPRTAAELYKYSTKIEKSALSKGDLIFFSEGSGVSHVGIWMGQGDKMIHAASEGKKTGVIITKFRSSEYWQKHYYGAGRIIGSETKYLDRGFESGATKEPSRWAFHKVSAPKNESVVACETDVFVDWSFLNVTNNLSYDYGFRFEGIGIDLQLRTNMFNYNFGIIGKFIFDRDDYKNLEFPLGLSVSTKYLSAYGAFIFPLQLDKDSDCSYRGNDYFIKEDSHPFMLGLKASTPTIQIGQYKMGLVQDISYTFYSVDKSNSAPVFEHLMNSGWLFQTGLRIRAF